MERYFNDDQMDYIKDLGEYAKQGKLCHCGWFTKDDCARRCNGAGGSPETQERVNAEYRAKYPERFAKASA